MAYPSQQAAGIAGIQGSSRVCMLTCRTGSVKSIIRPCWPTCQSCQSAACSKLHSRDTEQLSCGTSFRVTAGKRESRKALHGMPSSTTKHSMVQRSTAWNSAARAGTHGSSLQDKPPSSAGRSCWQHACIQQLIRSCLHEVLGRQNSRCTNRRSCGEHGAQCCFQPAPASAGAAWPAGESKTTAHPCHPKRLLLLLVMLPLGQSHGLWVLIHTDVTASS